MCLAHSKNSYLLNGWIVSGQLIYWHTLYSLSTHRQPTSKVEDCCLFSSILSSIKGFSWENGGDRLRKDTGLVSITSGNLWLAPFAGTPVPCRTWGKDWGFHGGQGFSTSHVACHGLPGNRWPLTDNHDRLETIKDTPSPRSTRVVKQGPYVLFIFVSKSLQQVHWICWTKLEQWQCQAST